MTERNDFSKITRTAARDTFEQLRPEGKKNIHGLEVATAPDGATGSEPLSVYQLGD